METSSEGGYQSDHSGLVGSGITQDLLNLINMPPVEDEELDISGEATLISLTVVWYEVVKKLLSGKALGTMQILPCMQDHPQ